MISPMLPQVNGAELVSTPNELNMAQPVQGFAKGGLPVPTQRPFLRASDREYLAARQAEYDKYMADVGAYNTALADWQTGVYNPYKSAVDAYNTAAQQYNTEVYNPYLAQVEAYNRAAQEYNVNTYQPYQSAYGQYVKAVEEWNAGPRTSAYAGPSAPSLTPFSMQAPTQPTPFSMAQPTLEREFTMAQPVMPFNEEDITAFQKSAAERAQFDAAQRGLAIDAVNDPRKYNLSGFSVSPKMFAQGGEARRMLERIPVVPRRFYDGGDVNGDPSGADSSGGSAPSGTADPGQAAAEAAGLDTGTSGIANAAAAQADVSAAVAGGGELGALAQAISLGLSPTGNPVSDAQVAQAVANAQMGALTVADMAALSSAGMGPATGFNIGNPTQSVNEMLAAQNVATVLGYLAPGAMLSKGLQMAINTFGPSSTGSPSMGISPIGISPVGSTGPTGGVDSGGGGAVSDPPSPEGTPSEPPPSPPNTPTPNIFSGGLEIPTLPNVMGANVPVYSMDGRMFRNPSEAHQAGVFNYSYVPLTSLPLTRPAVPSLPERFFAKGGVVGKARGMLDQLNRRQ